MHHDHEPPALHGVGHRASHDREDEHRDQLAETEQADRERRARQRVDLERHDDVHDRVAEVRDRLAQEQQTEVARRAERREVHEVPADASEQAALGGRLFEVHQRLRIHRSRSPRCTIPRTSTTSSSSRMSYMTRWSPTRNRWNESLTPWMVLTLLPPMRPGFAASSASFSRAVLIRFLRSGASFLNVRTAAGDSWTSYGVSPDPPGSSTDPWHERPAPGGADG